MQSSLALLLKIQMRLLYCINNSTYRDATVVLLYDDPIVLLCVLIT